MKSGRERMKGIGAVWERMRKGTMAGGREKERKRRGRKRSRVKGKETERK